MVTAHGTLSKGSGLGQSEWWHQLEHISWYWIVCQVQ